MRLSRLILIALILCGMSEVGAQDSVGVATVDSSAWAAKQVYFAPYYSQDIRSSVNFLGTFNDHDEFLPSYGVSIFNAIRAQLPSLTMPPSVLPVGAALRTSGSVSGDRLGYLIDGVPFNLYIGLLENYNMNGFEFASVSAASSANAMVLFDFPYAGGLMLRSRDGSGYSRGAVEFNTSFTSAWNDKSTSPISSHSLAYMKDFGRVDTRISYNLTTANEVWYHSAKINTCFAVAEKLFVRLILDERFNEQETYPNFSRVQNFFQLNLTARYAFKDWLDVTSQWVASRRDSTTAGLGRSWERNDYRDSWNLFVNARKKLGGEFSVSTLAGYQVTGLTSQRMVPGPSGKFLGFSTQSIMVGADVSVARLAEVSVKYRHTGYDTVRSGDLFRGTFSVGAGFNFSELLHWKSLPLGRLRLSYGEGQVTPYTSYPHNTFSAPAAGLASSHWELGVDASLGQSGMEMTVNYFASTTDSPIGIRSGYFAATLFTENVEAGWEAMLRYKTPHRAKVRNSCSLVFSSITSRWMPENQEQERYVRTGLFNETRWRSVSLGVLLEHSAITGPWQTNSLKVRDITVRIDSPSRASRNRFTFAVSARNLLDFLSLETDYEKNFTYKSYSVSLTLAL